jgi:hypothetical protein
VEEGRLIAAERSNAANENTGLAPVFSCRWPASDAGIAGIHSEDGRAGKRGVVPMMADVFVQTPAGLPIGRLGAWREARVLHHWT